MSYGIIYLVRCVMTGKCYVGQTIKSCQVRKNLHLVDARKGSRIYFHRAIHKYGIDLFDWDVIDDTASNQEELDALETQYIEEFDCIAPKGYNLKSGGKTGCKFCDESRKLLAKRKKEYYSDPANRETKSIQMKEITNRPEVRERKSQCAKEQHRVCTPENREEHSIKAKEMWDIPGKREEQSRRKKEYYSDPANREAQSKRKKEYYAKKRLEKELNEAQ